MQEKQNRKNSMEVFFKHETFDHVHDFMKSFFELPIFSKTIQDGLTELDQISKAYKSYIMKVKEKLEEDKTLKKKLEENLVCINNYLSKKYAKYELVKGKLLQLDHEMNKKFYEIRLSNFVPENLNHSVWEKPLRELKCIEFEKAPHKKLEALVKCLTAVSRAYMLLSDQTDEVTADDILQFSSFIFIKSKIKNIAGYLKYISAFTYTPPNEMQGIDQYCFITAESCIEYLRKLGEDGDDTLNQLQNDQLGIGNNSSRFHDVEFSMKIESYMSSSLLEQ